MFAIEAQLCWLQHLIFFCKDDESKMRNELQTFRLCTIFLQDIKIYWKNKAMQLWNHGSVESTHTKFKVEIHSLGFLYASKMRNKLLCKFLFPNVVKLQPRHEIGFYLQSWNGINPVLLRLVTVYYLISTSEVCVLGKFIETSAIHYIITSSTLIILLFT